MIQSRVIPSVVLSALMLACAPSDPDAGDGQTGVVVLALETVPTDAKCIRLMATSGPRTVTRIKDTSVGSPSWTSLFSGLPTGEVTLVGDAFNVACSTVTASSVPTWVSDAIVVWLDGGANIPVRMVLRRPATANVRYDFFDCSTRVDDTWSYPLSDASTPWRRAWGDPFTDSQLLVLTEDDVVTRSPDFVGDSYYFSVDLDFRAPVDVFPQFAGVSGPSAPNHPALRYSQGAVKLGGEHYGGGSLGTFGTFNGQTIASSKVIATVFVKGSTGEIAMHVKTDAVAMKSGFGKVASVAPGAIQLIGGNSGPPDSTGNGGAHLSALRGCQGLTAAQVQAAYDKY